jgi:hypothetical protein
VNNKFALLITGCSLLVGLLLVQAPVASGQPAPPKSYCFPTAGGTFTTSDSDFQAYLDLAVTVSGGLWVVEADLSPNEPGETLSDIFFGGFDGEDDIIFRSDPHLQNELFLPGSAGACPTAPPPGASQVQLCNKGWPSDSGMVVTAVSPINLPAASGPGIANPAADAVASGQWYYPNLISQGGKLHLSCFVPAGATDTGKVTDEQGNGYPAALVATLHAGGWARTMVYEEYTA